MNRNPPAAKTKEGGGGEPEEGLHDDHQRWHANHISPIYVSVRPACKWSDLCKEFQYDKEVLSLPFHWLQQQQQQQQQQQGHQSRQQVPSIRDILNVHGFLVVSGVLNQEECDQAMELAWDWIETASIARYNMEEDEDRVRNDSSQPTNDDCLQVPPPPVSRSDPSATVPSRYFPQSLENGGLIPYYGSGHSSFAWSIRSNPKVKTVFEQVHSGTTNLLSSLDAVILWRSGQEFRTTKGWFHVDQNPVTKPDFCCIQGLVNLLPNSGAAVTGGNVMVAQSHRLFPLHYTTSQFTSSSQTNKNSYQYYQQRLLELDPKEDFLKVDPLDEVLLGQSNASKIISCELQAGDMLLWDSRTVHCSYPPAAYTTTTTTAPNPGGCDSKNFNSTTTPTTTGGLLRAATVVSMMPARGVSKEVLQQRKTAVDECQTLTHWVDKCCPFFDDKQSTNYKVERLSVGAMKQLQQQQQQHNAADSGVGSSSSNMTTGQKVLLTFDDLTPDQRALVVGEGELDAAAARGK